jgi:hypothetical protein
LHSADQEPFPDGHHSWLMTHEIWWKHGLESQVRLLQALWSRHDLYASELATFKERVW